ncbi:exportin-1 [Nematocida sp. AWRm80]|nr:exportin-1 [Nematocida sp. AWRm80]
MEKVLESSQEFDVELFDRVIKAFYEGQKEDRERATKILLDFRDHPDSWSRTDMILKQSKDDRSKVFSIQVLERMVKVRWPLLNDQQKSGVREYVLEGLLENVVENKNELVKHLNKVLIEIIKREWPEQWPTLVSDLLSASLNNQNLCINTFNVLTKLIDEIYNDPRRITSKRLRVLTGQIEHEQPEILNMIVMILDKVSRGEITVPNELVISTLSLLRVLIPRVPVKYILEGQLSEILNRYTESEFNIISIKIARHMVERQLETPEEKSRHMEIVKSLFISATAFIESYFYKFKQIYTGALKTHYDSLSDKDKDILREMVIFYTSAYKHCKALELLECNTLAPLDPLIEISDVPEFELFRLCTEFWYSLVKELFLEFPFAPPPLKVPQGLRRTRYTTVLNNLVPVMVSQMAKPEEVTVIIDENGDIVQEKLSETEYILHNKEMKETLLNISAMLPGKMNMCSYLLTELEKALDNYSVSRINKVVWAIGSIFPSLQPDKKREYYLTIVNILTKKCMQAQTNKQKVIMATGIMYLSTRYMSILKTHWGFTRILFSKLFEFIQEDIEGLREMACEIFQSITRKIGTQLSSIHEKETHPFIDDMISQLHQIARKILPYQQEILYEAICFGMVGKIDVLLSVPMNTIASPVLAEYVDVQNVTHAVRIVKKVCAVEASSEFARSREKFMFNVFPIIQSLLEKVSYPQQGEQAYVRRALNTLKQEILELYIVMANGFSLEYVLGPFIEHCSQLILLPVTSSVEFTATPIILLEALCKRTVEGSKPLVDTISPPLVNVIMAAPQEKEDLVKAFFSMFSAAVRIQHQYDIPTVLSWLIFGVSHPNREVSEKASSALKYTIENAEVVSIRPLYLDLLECIIGAALDKDHEGDMDSLLVCTSLLIKHSIEETCPSQSQTLKVLGDKLYQTFPHLQPEDIQEFIDALYSGVNSQEILSTAFQDFRIRISII